MKLTLSPVGLSLIKRHEGFCGHPYRCPAGVPTIGYGATYYPDTGRAVTLRDPAITEVQASALLKKQVERFVAAVNRYVHVPLNQNQFDALVSLAYNIGLENLRTSTLLRLLNQQQYSAAAEQFPRWNKANGRIQPGLVRRRADEKSLFERSP